MTSASLPKIAIDALHALSTLEGNPTEEQRAALSAWPGWGPLSPALAMRPEGGWAKVADLIDVFVPEAELDVVRTVVDTSFYTGSLVADTVFSLLAATGFTGGRILEPGCGSGAFMSAIPTSWDVDWTGVEIDPVASRIAAALNPDATIINKPLEKVVFKAGGFDAVIGNVPFSHTGVFDPTYDAPNLHSYFLVRALDAVKPGGYVIAATSRHVLDTPANLELLQQNADLVTAIRLPSGAFTGTKVVADIIVLRRRGGARTVTGWKPAKVNRGSLYNQDFWGDDSYTVRTGFHSVDISSFWKENPGCVAGTLTATNWSQVPLDVRADDIDTAIVAAGNAARQMITVEPVVEITDPLDDVVLTDPVGRKEGSFHLIDGKVHRVINGAATPVARAAAELTHLIGLRDAALDLISMEANLDLPDEAIADTRSRTLDLYESYRAAFGPLNRGELRIGAVDPETGEFSQTWVRPTMGGFRRDPDAAVAFALERFDQDTGEAAPAPILLRRVTHRPVKTETAATPQEALAVTLGETGRVDLDRTAELLGLPSAAEAVSALAGLIFNDPTAGAYVTARDYLTGNVRDKLAAARTAAETDPVFQRNVDALTEVVPAVLGPFDIRVQLGVTWIPASDVEAFAKYLFHGWATVTHTPAAALWEVDGGVNYQAALEYGTTRVQATRLLECGLNGKSPVVYDDKVTVNGTKRIRNQVETLAAEEKLRKIQEHFATWVWEDQERSDRIVAEYNRRFNSHVVRRGDGSYLTFPGMDDSIELWSWQRDAIDRVVSQDRVLVGHPVGSGKTLSMIGGALTLRRLGLANKPMIVVPNHLLDQITREAQQAYPAARFLIASKDDLAKDARRLFAARCATGDWDAVVMTHQAFTSIGVDPQVEEDWVAGQQADLRWHLMEKNSSAAGAKNVAAQIRKLGNRVAELRDKVTDRDQITFELLGVDHISYDEAHYAKRLAVATRAEGFSLGSSKRATDLLLKIDTLANRYPGKPIVALFTGTPWTNTLAETYVWQKYLQPNRLEEAGVASFDEWAATFVRYETRVEVTPDGSSFRMYRRPSVMQNVPELSTMLAESADLLTADKIGLERPDATWENIVSLQSDNQAAFVRELAERSDDIRNGVKRQIGSVFDNMLMVCNDGRKVALDPRLVNLDEDSTKLTAIADNVARLHHRDKDRTFGNSPVTGAFQLVLCDLGTPRPNENQSYGRLRLMLAMRGVPADKVRFIHEAATDKARAHLFAQCREGAVSVLIGSTEKVGVGTNIQTRLAYLHHADAPWRPSDIEQREGRALRPKNLSRQVEIYRYITEGSFDSYIWQALTRKQRFISQMIAGATSREIDDVSEAVLNFAEVTAIAAGNPELMRQAELAGEVRRLRTVRAVWLRGVNALRQEAERATREARERTRMANDAEDILAAVTPPNTADNARLQSVVRQMFSDFIGATGWRGLRVRAEKRWNEDPRVIVGYSAYSTAHTITFTKAELRRDHDKIAAILETRLTAWLDSLADAAARFRAQAAADTVAAADAAQIAAAAVFEKEDELLAAELALATVEAAINDAAERQLAAA
ncbi:hypothetical protein ASF30_09475 [Leifsonia sp. Leaf264]|nr:hypothetical protein ASF30_09475 [Leifsonia sp. Leaf264]